MLNIERSKHIKVRLPFLIHPVERLFCFAGRIFQPERATLTDNNFENQLLCYVNRNW